MSKTAEVLEAGAEQLREWAEWAKTDCFETFEEWFLGIKLTDEEKPPIVTPAPKREYFAKQMARMRKDEGSPLYPRPQVTLYDPFKAATAALEAMYKALTTSGEYGVQMWTTHAPYDFGPMWRVKCRYCGARETFHAPDIREARQLMTLTREVREWSAKHGTNCVRAAIERDPTVEFHP